MKNNANYILNNCLEYINIFDALLGEYLDEDEFRAHYVRIAKIFGIRDKQQLDTFYDVLRGDLIREANCESKYNLLSRAINFCGHKFSDNVKVMVNCRQAAINIKKSIASIGGDSGVEGIVSGIGRLALSGQVSCISLMAYMKLQGLFVKKDAAGAVKMLRNAALWNDLFALLLCMKYDKAKSSYPPIIKAIFTAASQDEAYKHIERHLEIPENVEPSPTALAIEKRFYSGLSKKQWTSTHILNLLNSSVITDASKVFLIDTASENPDFSVLPLNISRNVPLSIPKKLHSKKLPNREAEMAAIVSNFSLYSLSRTAEANYKPLLIFCPDEYLLGAIKSSIIKSFHQNSVVCVDLKCAPTATFSPVSDNPIISELNNGNNACAAVIIEGCSELDASRQTLLGSFLRTSAKRELHLYQKLRFDYSGILPILMTSSAVCPELMRECDVVRIAPIKESDKHEFIRGIIDEKKSVFRLNSISVDEEAIKSLARHPLSTISSVIDRIVSLKAENGSALITDNDISLFLPKSVGFEPGSFWV